jgi:ABC-2 type transport system permease protein
MNDILILLLPGAMYFWVLFIGQGPLQEVVQEKENRILARVLACPVTPGEYVLAKMLRCFILCSLAAVLLLFTSALLFGIHWGNPAKLAVVILVWSASMTGLLSLIHALAPTREQANVLSPLVLMVFAMVGGSMFPYENLPNFLKAIGQYTPNRWAVVLLEGVVRGRPFTDLGLPFAALAGLGAGGMLSAFILFRRRLGDGGRK